MRARNMPRRRLGELDSGSGLGRFNMVRSRDLRNRLLVFTRREDWRRKWKVIKNARHRGGIHPHYDADVNNE